MSTQDMKSAPSPASPAATEIDRLISDLDGGQFERKLSIALSQVAAAAVDNNRKGEVTIRFKFVPIEKTSQVRIDHKLFFKRPTMAGTATEEEERATVMHVGKFGRISLAQEDMFHERQGKLDK